MKRSFYPLLLLAILSATALYSCKDEAPIVAPPNENPKDTTKYTTGTKPIFNANCALSGCHTAGASVGSLANYNDARAFASAGRILGALKHESGFSAMPKNKSKLDDSKIATVEKWIKDGLHE